MKDVSNLCMGCMEDRGPAAQCTHCGYTEGTKPDSPLHLRARTELHGQYVVGRVLGHGGFGITYLGWDLNLERKIAIKEYLPSGVAVRNELSAEVMPFSGETRKDFEYGLEKYLDEARTVARFQTHPAIVHVLNFFRSNGTAYLVMEYLEGATLERFLEANGGKVSYETMIKVMVPVLEALGTVHQQGILHRDISPDNVYITRKWQVKILDFGAARYALGQKSRNLSVILKEGYAPVEQYHSKGNQGPWTDVYCCGATLYRALTGVIPPGSLDRMQADTMKTPSALGAVVSIEQERAILKALSVHPEYRFHTMQAFKDALTGLLSVPENEMEAIRVGGASTSGMQQVLDAASAPPISGGHAAVTVRSGQPLSGGVLPRTQITSPTTSRPRVVEQTSSLSKWIWGMIVLLLLATIITVSVIKSRNEAKLEAESQQYRKLAQQKLDEELGKQKALLEDTQRHNKELRQRADQDQIDRIRKEYEELLKQSGEMSTAGKYKEAVLLSQQAIKLDPTRPDAYSRVGWTTLYGTGDLKATVDNYKEAVQRGGVVFFRVIHDHQGGTFQNRCEGNLGLSKTEIQYQPKSGPDALKAPIAEVQEIKDNPEGKSVSGDFHVQLSGNRRFEFLPVTNAKPVRDMILQLSRLR